MELREEGKAVQVRRNYKDSVFRLLFADEKGAIELFNALEGTSYGDDTEVIFTTLEDALYHGIKNDLGFIIDNRFIVLTEHQSTKSMNIPLRQLQYIARTYETQVDSVLLYRKKMVKIPTPEFYIIYTGPEPWENDMLRLSDAFIDAAAENSLELVVKVIDVRYNDSNEILARSEKLKGYSLLLNYVGEYQTAGSSLKEAIEKAVSRCLQEGILRDFLKSHSSEVGSMLFDDITWEKFAEIRAEEAAEEAAEKAAKKAAKEARKEGIEEMQTRMNRLTRTLLAENRIDDLKRASEDIEFQNQLFEELNI